MTVGELVAEGWTIYAVPHSLRGNAVAESLIQGDAALGLINLSCCISQPGYEVWYYMAVSPEAKPSWNTTVPNAYQVEPGEEALTSEIPGQGVESAASGFNPLGIFQTKIPLPGIAFSIPLWVLVLFAWLFIKRK